MRSDVEIKAITDQPRRIRREMKTVTAMAHLYCRQQHNSPPGTLCLPCQELLDYALLRLSKCPFSAAKPTCAQCLIHCYKADMRDRVREMMRYAGPRLLRRHPILAIRHLLDGRKEPPCRDDRHDRPPATPNN